MNPNLPAAPSGISCSWITTVVTIGRPAKASRAICRFVIVWFLAIFVAGRSSPAAEPVTLTNVTAPPPVTLDEPLAAEFSLEQAARYLDSSTLSWLKSKNCVACHTMSPYLMARPALDPVLSGTTEVRRFFEDITATPEKAFPDYLPTDGRAAVVVTVATTLAFNDRITTGKLHPLTAKALDRMWETQRADGGWDWPFRDVPPIKDSEHYGVTFAALGIGFAPESYARTAPAQKGLEGIRRYLKNHPPITLHERMMLLWVSQSVEGILTEDERSATVTELLSVQRPDGGWSLANLVENPRNPARQTDAGRQARTEANHGSEFLVFVGRDHIYRMPLVSDGYSTGLTMYILRQAGVPSDGQHLRAGVAWLKSHQRASGRWFTPSLGFHKQHLMSNIGTAYAVLALEACGEIPSANARND